MASITTFIKLDRNIKTWRWYQDANTMRVFLDLLIDANVVNHDFQGITIHRGEIATSYESIGKKLKLSVQSVRTAINHLKSTGELTATIYPKFQVISIVNYDKYQRKLTGKSTGNQQQYKNNKNNKNDKNKAADTLSLDAEWSPPKKGTPEYERWRNQ